MSDDKWWRWPEDRRRGLVPWFTILRRLIFWPIYALGAFLYVLGVGLGFGVDGARRAWDQMR